MNMENVPISMLSTQAGESASHSSARGSWRGGCAGGSGQRGGTRGAQGVVPPPAGGERHAAQAFSCEMSLLVWSGIITVAMMLTIAQTAMYMAIT
jgi:hypothetical protein